MLSVDSFDIYRWPTTFIRAHYRGLNLHGLISDQTLLCMKYVYLLCRLKNSSNKSQIIAQFRIPSRDGGDERRVITRKILNATGNNMQVIHDYDFNFLNGSPPGLLQPTQIGAMGGLPTQNSVTLEMRIVCKDVDDGLPKALTDWFPEQFVIQPPPSPLLSGKAMRDRLYFVTAPGNSVLYLAVNMEELMRRLSIFEDAAVEP